ncbi:protein ALTERED XYLOGLUCAN 4-like [Ananas comosus]|uniref:Protein ALTERED XYLOGLUCAN 4-like n=1 Tax=Ananas comosus TaxID=4615 RepID=A0A6P5F9X4_ANACO|nr:protein ALTERED XYLOGLUCAN 4-like [Ananas comosus]
MSQNMASPHSPSTPRLLQFATEWNVLQKKIGSFLLLLLLLSALFLLSILYSSSTLTVTTEEAVSEGPLLAALLAPTALSSPQKPSPESNAATYEAVHQSNSSVAPVTETTSQSPVSDVEDKCEMSRGKWVAEPRGPLYTNVTCPTIPDFKNCMKYGKHPGFLYWRWKPDRYDLPRFEPERFLNIVQGKKLAFIGDSLARNQMESLLCLLSQAETPIDVYKDRTDRFRTWFFPSHNFTLMVMWTEFYVQREPRVVNGSETGSFNIHVDKINTNWTSQLSELNYAVISGGNWFFRINYLYEDDKIVGCVNCWEKNITDFGIPYAVRRVVRKALESISACGNCDGLVTFLRTYTPPHFENGSWFSGGYCNKTKPLDESDLNLNGIEWELRKIQNEEIERVREKSGGKKFGLLDVTKAMMLRADAHPGADYDKRWVRNANDCLHWCLPGPVDMWNEVLLQDIIKNSSVE